MNKTIDYFKDIIKSLMIGIMVAFIIMVLAALISVIEKNNNIKEVLEIVKNTLFIIGAFGLLMCSGFILKREARRPLSYEDQWKEKFRVIKFQNVLMVITITILCFGIGIDRIIYYW